MTVATKVKKTIIKKEKCYFCSRTSANKGYYVDIHNNKGYVCSMCKYIYEVIKREKESGRLKAVERIINVVEALKRHCTNCRYCDTKKLHYCKKGLWTGIGQNEDEYPLSFANHGCGTYTPIL